MKDKQEQSNKTETTKPHKRRVRYAGTHPRRFEEKYKELDPQRYGDTIEHVIDKGITPAGMHIPIMVDEILNILCVKPGQIGVDATLGYGGHTSKILECLDHRGHLYSLDVDPIESVKTEERLRLLGYDEDVLTICHMNFKDIDLLTEKYGKMDFAMADLGVSSMQIDNPERGFSYKQRGPLDLRMNPERGINASERLLELSAEEMEGMFLENADEPYAHEIVQQIIRKKRSGCRFRETTELSDTIEEALRFLPEDIRDETVKKSCQRVFQALRIDVNSEFEALEAFMTKLPDMMKPGGRIAILTFHSGEDRLVKKALKAGYKAGIYQKIAEDVVRPGKEECIRNARARSTKMRWAVLA